LLDYKFMHFIAGPTEKNYTIRIPRIGIPHRTSEAGDGNKTVT
jgi:hypothetical protein